MAGEVVEAIGLFGAGAAGGVVGIFGSLIGVASKWLMRREERKARKDEIEHELKLIEAQMRQAGRAFEHEIAITAQAGQYQAFTSAIEAEARLKSGYRWVEAVRALFRPFITTALCVACYAVLQDLLSAKNPSPGVISLAYDLYFATGSCVAFWFGDRSFTPRERKW